MRKQRLEIEVVSTNRDYVTFRISKQTCRNAKFGTQTLANIGCPETGHFYSEQANINIYSSGGPAFENGWQSDVLYVRGNVPEYDLNTITVSKAKFEKIKKAISEFNDYFTAHGCGGLCGAVLCKECLAHAKNAITFTFDGEDVAEIAV